MVEVDINDVCDISGLVFIQFHVDAAACQCGVHSVQCQLLTQQFPADVGLYALVKMLLLSQGLVEPEFFFEMLEGGLKVEEAGFEGAPDAAPLVVKHSVKQTMMLTEAGAFFAGIGFDVVEVKHRIELLKVGVIIFFHHIMNDV